MKEKAQTTIGVFVGIMDPEKNGSLLLVRRETEHSIIPGKSFKGNWQLPGGAVTEPEDNVSYDYHLQEGFRRVMEETGMTVDCSRIPQVETLFFKGPQGCDLAIVVPVITFEVPRKGEFAFRSPDGVVSLAKYYNPADKERGIDGTGLLSGKGKRMYCLCLASLRHSPNNIFAKQADILLQEEAAGW